VINKINNLNGHNPSGNDDNPSDPPARNLIIGLIVLVAVLELCACYGLIATFVDIFRIMTQ